MQVRKGITMIRWKMALLGGCLVLGGCAGPVVLNYAPSSTMTVKGAEKVGSFSYAPAAGGKVKPNQVRNTAVGNIYFEKPIHEYFEKAVLVESRFVGIDVSGSGPLVHGTINEFLIDDLGYSVDWTLNVTYIVDGTNGKACFESQKKLARNTNKFANIFGTLNEIVKDNIELLFKDPAFASCISRDSASLAGTGSAGPEVPTVPDHAVPQPATASAAPAPAAAHSDGGEVTAPPSPAAPPAQGRPLSYIRLH